MRWHDVAFAWHHTKDHNRSRNICFHNPGHVPVIRGNPDLHYEDVGNVPVVITWIGRVHVLYSGASSISVVENCLTFRHDSTLLSLLGFIHNWPISRWSATKKKKLVFIKRKWNHITFSRVTILSLLYIDLRPSQTCHSKVMHRKEVSHSDGSYERKSRSRAWPKKYDKAKIPWYTHRLMHRKRVTSELHGSYLRLMTIKHDILKVEWTI